MKKKKTILIVSVSLLLCCAVGFFVLRGIRSGEQTPFPIVTVENELLTKSQEGYNSVEVYRQNGRLVINAKSEAEFFDGAQFVVETQRELSPSDVEIVWTTLGGGTQKTEKNDRFLAEVKVRQEGKMIFDRKINFLKKAFEAVDDVLKRKEK